MNPPVAPAARVDVGSLSQGQLIVRRFKKHRLALASLYVLAVLYILAGFCEFFSPDLPGRRHLDYLYAPPNPVSFSFDHGLFTYDQRQVVDPITFRKTYVVDESRPLELEFLASGPEYALWGLITTDLHFVGIDHGPSSASAKGGEAPPLFLLGADKYGRDVLTRALYGSRISLSVGFIGLLGTFVLGMVLGGISGYLGGRVDDLIQRFIEILQSFPQLPLWIALAAILPGDWSSLAVYFSITLLLSLLNWTGLARVVRGKILALREEDYAVAARLLGASHTRILFLHLMPGFASHIIVSLTLSVPVMILGETALSFLGLGLRPPLVSWGVMLQSCMDIKAVSFYPWLLTPVVFIILLVLSFNFLGDGIRDAADPYGGRK